MSLTSNSKNLLLVIISVIFSLLLGEVGLRLIFPQPTYSRLISQLGSYYTHSEYNTFTLKPSYFGSEPSMEGPENTRVSVNSKGLRGPELGNDPRILMLGDSYTFGIYVSDEETFSALLEKRLYQEGYKYQVLNAGYTDGHETDQQYVWLKHNIEKLAPKIVMLNVFLGNDIRFINPDAWADLDADGLPSKWLDKNIHVEPNGILRNTQIGPSTVGETVIYRLPILRDSHLCILVAKAFDQAKNKLLKIPTGYYDKSFEHIFGIYSPELDRLARSNGARFAVSLLPINFMVEREKMDIVLPGSQFRNSDSVYYRRLSGMLEKNGIVLVNIEDAMKQSKEGPFFPENGEVHFNRRGHAFTSEKIYEFLRAGDFLENSRH
jgi:hypothetical protein